MRAALDELNAIYTAGAVESQNACSFWRRNLLDVQRIDAEHADLDYTLRMVFNPRRAWKPSFLEDMCRWNYVRTTQPTILT